MIYIFVRFGFGGICYRITGNIATKASTMVPKLATRPANRSDWLKMPKLMILSSRMGRKMVTMAELGILYIVIIKCACSNGFILLDVVTIELIPLSYFF